VIVRQDTGELLDDPAHLDGERLVAHSAPGM
jgi:hypothetical protein